METIKEVIDKLIELNGNSVEQVDNCSIKFVSRNLTIRFPFNIDVDRLIEILNKEIKFQNSKGLKLKTIVK